MRKSGRLFCDFRLELLLRLRTWSGVVGWLLPCSWGGLASSGLASSTVLSVVDYSAVSAEDWVAGVSTGDVA